MNDKQKVESCVSRYHARHAIYPSAGEVSALASMPLARVRDAVEQSDRLELSWTGPKPPGLSSMIVEFSEVSESEGEIA